MELWGGIETEQENGAHTYLLYCRRKTKEIGDLTWCSQNVLIKQDHCREISQSNCIVMKLFTQKCVQTTLKKSNVLVDIIDFQLQYCLAETEHTQRCLGTSTLWASVTSWQSGEQPDALVASFPLLVEHVPTVVNLSMYHALVGTVWATIRTGASIHHGPVTYSTLSEETKWSFWRNVNNPQWTISGSNWRVEHRQSSVSH